MRKPSLHSTPEPAKRWAPEELEVSADELEEALTRLYDEVASCGVADDIERRLRAARDRCRHLRRGLRSLGQQLP